MSITERESLDRGLFNEIAGSYCAKDRARPSRVARRHRLRQTLRHVPVGREIALLEVGCGAGFTASYLAGCYREFVGIDYAEELIGYARLYNQGPGVRFEIANVNDFRTEQRFDVVLMIGVLHHLDDLDASLGAMSELLKPGGWLVANEPQPANPLIHLARSVRKRVDKKYSREQKELSGAELEEAFGRAGFEDIRLVPQGTFSTPFAEVPFRPEGLWVHLSGATCLADRFLEAVAARWLRPVTWNLVVIGRRPPEVRPPRPASERGVFRDRCRELSCGWLDFGLNL